jgi:phosphotriesterase-related protein
MIKELKEGISGTSIKAGIIGELGATNPLGINEKQVLIAGAQAQVETGAAINVHVDPFSMGGEHEVLDILQNAGANRIVLSHMDVRLLLDQRSLSKGMKLLVSLAESGAFIEFDTWGLNDFDARRSMRRPSDWERLCVLRELCDQGFTSQVLISQDISMKTKLRKYGGFGIGYILREIVPRMRMMGFDPEMIQTILVRNPADLLFGPLDDESPES